MKSIAGLPAPSRFSLALLLLVGSPPGLLAQEAEELPDPPDTSAVVEEGAAAEEGEARIYLTREERREAGLKHRITSWLTASGLAEVEAAYEWLGLPDPSPDRDEGTAAVTLQLGLEMTPWSWVKGEAIFEVEHGFEGESPTGTLDEAIVALLGGAWELEAGRLFVPFGEYYSHFVSGPLLEVAETRGDGLVLSWAPEERLDLSVFLYHGEAEEAGTGESADWGFATEVLPLEALTLGLSYLSDLADSEEGLLDAVGDQYAHRVDALSGYAVVGFHEFEVTTEFVWALDAFEELEADRNRPGAWNIELAVYPGLPIDAALRLEGSDEVVDAPRIQGGIALSWRAAKTASVTLEYLHGAFEAGLSESPEALDTVRHLGAQFSLAF